MEKKYTNEQLNRIRAQSIIYQCACPAQVTALLSSTQSLYDYQTNCLNRDDVDVQVHQNIADATLAAYAVIEQCLTDVLLLEGWDLNTLEMPEAIRDKLLRQIDDE